MNRDFKVFTSLLPEILFRSFSAFIRINSFFGKQSFVTLIPDYSRVGVTVLEVSLVISIVA